MTGEETTREASGGAVAEPKPEPKPEPAPKSAPVPSPRYAFAGLMHWTVVPAFKVMFRIRVRGLENIPEGGGIIAGNHRSYADPVIIWSVVPRVVHFMAKSELAESRILAWMMKRVWAFPVKRGSADRAALALAGSYMAAGELVGMFPEGTRNVDGEAEAHGGVAFLAMRNDVPIVPVGLDGTDLIKPPGARFIHFPKVTVSFGEPVYPADVPGESRRERMDALTGIIMERIEAELGSAKGA